MAAFDEAVERGAVTWEDVRPGIEKGYLKPSLADHFPEGRMIRQGVPEALSLIRAQTEQIKQAGDELVAARAKNDELQGELDSLGKSAALTIGRALTLGLSGSKRRRQ
jgi:hypothetical protein